ncbi:LuxR C-terminal-related transcriptional regulator [Actinacidiphila rubida]|uniref:Regulatory protein, luxR family n=1 Tax=Actinacidiphila rubida TaxID=310780 RepID=A0A1H8V1I6_9ACTN|nr:LuxR C-terminal-related transcriptional regulator [Actinacidiphila rubida]SEP09352.1 regulatory protein, luxR family [Actinacidiphila rubida]
MLETLGLSAEAAAVYQVMLSHPAADVAGLAGASGLTPAQVHDCLDELGQYMLVRASGEHPGQLRAVSPEIGLADMITRQEADLAARQAHLAASRAAVTRMVAERADHRTTQGERILGLDGIQDLLERLGRAVRTEVIGVQPGIQTIADIEAARPADAEAFSRGVTMRTLYQEAARKHPHLEVHAHWLLSQGGEVRTAPTIPQRMVIFDRTQAVVPIDPADHRRGALHVTEPGILTALLDLFEQAWNTAVPLGATRYDEPESGLSGTERELLRLLGGGLTDETAAQRLGTSSRTVRRQMAAIMERLNATSRFEAGIKAAQRGWLQ